MRGGGVLARAIWVGLNQRRLAGCNVKKWEEGSQKDGRVRFRRLSRVKKITSVEGRDGLNA